MFRFFCIAGLALTTQAQVSRETTVTGSDGDLVVERRDAISVTDLAASVARLETMMSSMIAGSGPIQAGVAAIAADMTTRTNTIIEQGARNDERITALATQMETLTSSVDNQLTAAGAAVASQLTAASSTNTAAIETVTASLTTSMAEMNASITRGVGSQLTAASAALATLNRSVVSAVAVANSKMSTYRHTWVGGCRQHSHGGWREVCLNRVDKQTMAPMFRVQTGTRFQAIARGWYHLSIHTIGESCNWQSTALRIGGTWIYHGYLHTQGWWWKDSITVQQYEVTAGQQYWFEVSSGCSRLSYHSTRHHGIIESTYLGQIHDRSV